MTEIEADRPETEITPAMIEAGVHAYLDHGELFETLKEIVTAIYRAMDEAKGARLPPEANPPPASS